MYGNNLVDCSHLDIEFHYSIMDEDNCLNVEIPDYHRYMPLNGCYFEK